uniref:Ig-like domain-containing protein n=1 Tax=Electrophorus electricus TaxID=8005 RepID=A0AAY5EJX2_ELEEL
FSLSLALCKQLTLKELVVCLFSYDLLSLCVTGVYGKDSCWSVTYVTQSTCALIGSSVDIRGYYTFPDQQPTPQPAWYARLHPQVKELSHADDRVEVFSHRANVNTLRLKHLTESDSAEYLLRFKAPYMIHTDSSAGVSLSVTGLKVNVDSPAVPGSEGQTVTLSCSSTCTLPYNPTYIWYKNRQRVSHCTSVSCSVSAVRDAVSYSCATEGHENLLSPPVCENTRALMVSSGERVEGDSVTLTCSSEENPPVLTYSWFKQRAAADTLLATGQNYSISNISSQHSGLYYCTAHNQLGQHNSTTTLLDVLYPPRVPSVTDRVSGDAVTLLCYSDSNPISNYSWYKKTGSDVILFGNGTNLTIATGTSGCFYCVVQNQFGSSNSSEWSFTSGTVWVEFTALLSTCLMRSYSKTSVTVHTPESLCSDVYSIGSHSTINRVKFTFSRL